jgi:hypothetical protein
VACASRQVKEDFPLSPGVPNQDDRLVIEAELPFYVLTVANLTGGDSCRLVRQVKQIGG